MTDTNTKVRELYNATGLTDRIKSALTAIAPEGQTLTAAQLAPLDQFHTRGILATAELANAAGLDRHWARGRYSYHGITSASVVVWELSKRNPTCNDRLRHTDFGTNSAAQVAKHVAQRPDHKFLFSHRLCSSPHAAEI